MQLKPFSFQLLSALTVALISCQTSFDPSQLKISVSQVSGTANPGDTLVFPITLANIGDSAVFCGKPSDLEYSIVARQEDGTAIKAVPAYADGEVSFTKVKPGGSLSGDISVQVVEYPDLGPRVTLDAFFWSLHLLPETYHLFLEGLISVKTQQGEKTYYSEVDSVYIGELDLRGR